MSWFQVPEPSLRWDPVIFPAGSRVHSIPETLRMCFSMSLPLVPGLTCLPRGLAAVSVSCWSNCVSVRLCPATFPVPVRF